MAAKTMRYGSLFSGIGGFDLGLDRAGMECSWQVELDGAARAVLAAKWPKAKQHQDVREVGAHNLEPVDLICAGFPCQDLSVAGKRAGLDGERSGLFFELLRVLAELRPGWFVLENVPGLLSSRAGRDFAVVLSGLVGLGYGVCWRVLDSQYFGLAQRRKRVFIVGHLGSGRAAEVLFEPESLRRDSAPSRATGARVAATLTSGSHPGSSASGRRREDDVNLAACLSAHHGRNCGEDTFVSHPLLAKGNSSHDDSIETYVAHALTAEGFDASEDGTGRGTPIVAQEISGTLGGGSGQRGYANSPDVCGAFVPVAFDTTQLTSAANRSNPQSGDPCHPLAAGAHAPAVAFGWNKSSSQTMRVDDDTTDALQASSSSNPAIAFTERTRADGRNLETQEELAYALTNPGAGGRTQERNVAGRFGVRRLMPDECARLQGFPDGWGAGQSDSARYRQFGNAVSVDVPEWIGRRIVAVAGGGAIA